MMRWAVQLDEHVKTRLPIDTLELGDLHRREDGSEVLIFRDRFVALKVAAKVGGSRPVAFTRSAD
jgi:hypothetical protein